MCVHKEQGCPALTPLSRRLPADRKSTRLNSSHSQISYAVFCLKKKKKTLQLPHPKSQVAASLFHSPHVPPILGELCHPIYIHHQDYDDQHHQPAGFTRSLYGK